MNKHITITILTLTFVTGFIYQSFAAEDSFIPRLARVSALEGEAYFQGTDMFEWEKLTVNTPIRPGDRLGTDKETFMEIELDDGNYIRMADSSKLDIISMDINETDGFISTETRIWIGDFYGQVQQMGDTGMDFLVNTANAQLQIQTGSAVFRVIVYGDGALELRIHSGTVNILTRTETIIVHRRQMVIIDSKGVVSAATGFEWWEKDGFDHWNEQRMDYVSSTRSYEKMDRTFRSGYSDLDRYGRWAYVGDYGNVWIPTVSVGWVPYRYGRWNYISPWGWTWISYEPWGWIPYHYGSWTWTIDFGWVWVPGYYWSPGWVSWYYGNGYVGWVALHPWDNWYCSFSVNYCFWFPYYCHHRHHHHDHHHHHHTYHQGHHHDRGDKRGGDHGDHGKNSFREQHIRNYGESVPMNSTHKIGINSSTSIRAEYFFNNHMITESTRMVSTEIDVKNRNWTSTLPELNNLTEKTGVSRSALKSIPAFVPSSTQSSTGKTGTDSSTRVKPGFNTSEPVWSKGTTKTGTSNRSRISAGARNTSESVQSFNTQSRQSGQSTNVRRDSDQYTITSRTQTYSTGSSDQKKTTGYIRSNRTNTTSGSTNQSRSSSGYNRSKKEGNSRTSRTSSGYTRGSTYLIPQKQTGIKNFFNSLMNLRNKSGSTTGITRKNSQTSSAKTSKSGSSKSSTSKSSSSKSKKSKSSSSKSKKK